MLAIQTLLKATFSNKCTQMVITKADNRTSASGKESLLGAHVRSTVFDLITALSLIFFKITG